MSQQLLRRFQPSPQQIEIATVRAAWRLTPPEPRYQEPMWFRQAVFAAVRAGRLPKDGYARNGLDRLKQAGYREIFDHPAVLKSSDHRFVIAEPYETSCHIDQARAMADQLATILGCATWVAMRSWHYPGWTIRIGFAQDTESLKQLSDGVGP